MSMCPWSTPAIEITVLRSATAYGQEQHHSKSDVDNLPCTPTLYDTCEQGLLGVIGNVRAKAIYNTTEVAIRTSCHSRFDHCVPDWMKDSSE